MTGVSSSSSSPPRALHPRARALAWSMGIAAAALAPLVPAWLAGRTLVCRDSITIYAPLRHLVGEALRAGHLPLWQPFSGTGYPVFAELMHGVLHPLSVAAAVLFPGDSLDPLIGMNVAAAALGAAVLARTLGTSGAASAGAGIAYGLCGFTLSASGNFVFLAGAGALPWLVASMLALGREGTPSSLAGAICGAAAAALSGDVQAVAVGALLGTLLALEVAGVKGALRASAGLALGLLVASVQLVPSWVHLARTDRGGSALPLHVEAWSFAPWRAVEWVVPGFFVQPEAGLDAPVYAALGDPKVAFTPFALSTYVGVPVLALAAAGLRARRAAALLGACALSFAWLSAGDHLGAHRLLSLLPLVRSFRYAEKWQGPLTLCLSALAAFGIDRAASDRRVALRLAASSAAVVLISAGAWMRLRSSGEAALPEGTPAADLVAGALERGLRQTVGAGAGLLVCAAAFLRGSRRVAAGMAAVLLWSAAAAASPYALRAGRRDARTVTPPPALSAGPPGPRLFHLRGPAARPPLPGFDPVDQIAYGEGAFGMPNRNVPFALDVLEPWTGLRPVRHLAVEEAFADRPWEAARRFGATHAIFPPPTTERGMHLAQQAIAGGARLAADPRNGAEIWSVPHRPWASFPPQVIVAAGREEALRALLRLTAEGSSAAVVESGEAMPGGAGRVTAISRELESLRIEAEAERDATLVINDAYWPGWRATVDGRAVPLYAADVLVRAVPFPKGRHVLEMSYEPPEVRLGAALSTATVGALLVAWLVARRWDA